MSSARGIPLTSPPRPAYPTTYEEIIARDQHWEDHWSGQDGRPSKVQGWAYRWQETCPCCGHKFRIELDTSEGFSHYERTGKYETECPECFAELSYPFELEYVVSLGKRELVKAGTVPDPNDPDPEQEEEQEEEQEPDGEQTVRRAAGA